MNLEEKVKVLNNFAKDWYSTSQADRIHAAIFRKQGLVKLADKCMEEAKEELEEAEKCTARVVALGGKPEYGFNPQEIHDDAKDLLQRWSNEFIEGIPAMNKVANSFDDDYVTREMFNEFIKGEEEHCAWVNKHLEFIKKVGYENYLIEMSEI